MEEKLAAAQRQLALAPQHNGAAYMAEAYTGPPQTGSSMLTRDHMCVTVDQLRQMKSLLKEMENGE